MGVPPIRHGTPEAAWTRQQHGVGHDPSPGFTVVTPPNIDLRHARSHYVCMAIRAMQEVIGSSPASPTSYPTRAQSDRRTSSRLPASG